MPRRLSGRIPADFGIQYSPIATVISNPRLPDNPIVAANHAFYELTRYGAADVIGRNCRFLAGPDTEPSLTDAIRGGTRDRRSVLVEILNYRRDGSRFRNAVLVAPIFDTDGALAYYMGTQCEMPDRPTGTPPDRHQAALTKVGRLSPRQRQILAEIAAGHSSKRISYDLHLSEKTVKMHRTLLFAKLEAPSIATAVRIAVEAGL
ncbi:MAG TPA: LuxR C-terminal-related transcriptional regulator [Sphingomonas sp.]|jgi:hypothetical protein